MSLFGFLRKRKTKPSGVILLYHRVAELQTDPQLLAVTPIHFREHLDFLRRKFGLISLDGLLKRNPETEGTPVVITFDDGYADNLHYAAPLLEDFDAPATIFVASHHTDSHSEFWWDDAERLLLQPGTLPQKFEFSVSGHALTADLSSDAVYRDDDFSQHKGWNVLQKENPTKRHELYRRLCPLLRTADVDERKRVLAGITEWAGQPSHGRVSHRSLTGAELQELGNLELIDIGAHTVHHPVLSSLPRQKQWEEIQQSKIQLEKLLQKSVTTFAYPYGNREDYTAETVQLVKDAGFEKACSNFAGTIDNGTDRWQLPRILVRDWSAAEFERRLENWLN